MLAIGLVAASILHGDLARFENPEGEKGVPLFPAGQNDFSYTYLGARALLAGVNPYHNDRPEFTHPLFPPSAANGYKQMYPPGNLLLHVPFALWKGTDWQAAGRIWFRLSLMELGVLSVLTWALIRRAIVAPLTPVWIAPLFLCLALNTGVELGLERGQSDIAVALLAWLAVACFLRGRYGASAFLSIWSTSIKGYSILLSVGLILLALDRRQWKPTFFGVALAVLVLILPVGRYWGESMKAVKFRSDMFWPVWYNHGFSSAVDYLMPAWRRKGRLVLSAFALLVSIAAWFQTRRALSRGRAGAGVFWLAAYATASLGTLIGYASLSVSYNLILVLPGVLILVATQERLGLALVLPPVVQHALGGSLLVSSFLLFSYRLGGQGLPIDGTGAPASAFGLVGLFLILASLAARALSKRIRPATTVPLGSSSPAQGIQAARGALGALPDRNLNE